MLTETQKIWLTNLLETEIEIEKKTISNERVWENGCDDEFNPHSGNIDEHEGYIEILKEIKEKYCNN